MEVEYALYEMLHAKGLVRLHAAPRAITGPAPPHSLLLPAGHRMGKIGG